MEHTKQKVVATIQARMGSTRLPLKALKKIKGRTLIEWIVYRLSFCKEVDQVVLSTSDSTDNDILAAHAEEIGLPYFRGSEVDLVSRLNGTANTFEADALIRITGDCPLVDPTIVDRLVREFRDRSPDIDYVSNIVPPTYPDGMDVEVVATKALKRLDTEVTDPLYREWVTTTIMENPDKFNVHNITCSEDISDLRLTVDYQEDMDLVEAIIERLHKEGEVFTMTDMLELFKKEPELLQINEKWVDKGIQNNIRSGEFHSLKEENNT